MSHDVPQESTALSERQQLAIPYLTASSTFTEAAEKLGVSRRTIHRWLTEPAFRKAYERQREETAALATAEIRALMLKAAVALSQNLESDDPNVRARASRDVMAYGFKLSDAEKNRKVIERLNRFLATAEGENRYYAENPQVRRAYNPNSLRR